MTEEKFAEQITTVAKFIQTYCDDHHDTDRLDGVLETEYKGKKISIPYHLCADCKHMLLYSNDRLRACPHEQKPSCRNCKQICYDKNELRYIVKIMRSVGIKLGLSKLKSKVLSFVATK